MIAISRLFVRFVPFACLVAALAGCGGGGGGGSSTSSNGISVKTDWTQGTAQSEQITVLSPSGTTVSQMVVNRAGNATTISSISAPQGAYTVRVQQSAAASFASPANGILTYATTGGSLALNITAGVSPTALEVTPSSLSLSFGQTFQLGVTGLTAAGTLAFIPPGAEAFTPTGTSASVNATGLVTASSSAGTTTISAADSVDHLTTVAAVNVQSASLYQGTWTVLVFLNASNDLYPYALPNVQQMAQVAYNANVRFVVQWKESAKLYGSAVDFDGTRRYLVTTSTPAGSTIPGTLVQNLGDGVDMGKVQTLQQFITWGKANYPADHYLVDVWDHGNGWQPFDVLPKPPPTRGVSFDFETGNYISTWQLSSAFVSQPVDVISFDACLMQMMEIADDLKTCCAYVAASEENTPGPGYPYQRVFQAFADSPTSAETTLLQSFVTGQIGNPSYQTLPVTQSVIDMTKLTPIESAIDGLALALIAELASATNGPVLKSEIPKLRSALQKYGDAGDGNYYYDLVDLANHLNADTLLPSDVRSAAAALASAVTPAVVWEGNTSLDSNSHGLAIDFSPSSNPNLVAYSNLNLSKTTHWLDWLQVAP